MTRENEMNTTSTGLPRTLENPVTGERVTFLVTPEETNGEYVRVRCYVPAGAQGPPLPPRLHGELRRRGGPAGRVPGKKNRFVLEEG